MQNKKLIILIVLGIAAVFSLIYGIVAPAKTRKNMPLGQEAIHQGEKIESQNIVLSPQRRAKKTKFSSWGRNPFLPKSATAESGLTGIIWNEDNPKAIINDEIVAIGDKIDGKTVIDIKQDRIILNDGTKEFDLRLNQ